VTVGSVVTRALEKTYVKELRELRYASQFGHYNPDQIANMSLNGLRRQVETHDKTLTWTQMDEPSVALDSGHHVSARGTPLPSFHCPKKHFFFLSIEIGFGYLISHKMEQGFIK
jgi:hypothetical protein